MVPASEPVLPSQFAKSVASPAFRPEPEEVAPLMLVLVSHQYSHLEQQRQQQQEEPLHNVLAMLEAAEVDVLRQRISKKDFLGGAGVF
jgi:hypothetical protein